MRDTVYAISACLLGVKCGYDGKDSLKEGLREFMEGKKYIQICPEVFGGLPIPRISSEIRGGKVINKLGEDVSEEFLNGAKLAVAKMVASGVSVAILKENSPSCGVGTIYDGTFTHTLIVGDGVFAQEAKKAGIQCYTFDEFQSLFMVNGDK